jgi:hypothetical protein
MATAKLSLTFKRTIAVVSFPLSAAFARSGMGATGVSLAADTVMRTAVLGSMAMIYIGLYTRIGYSSAAQLPVHLTVASFIGADVAAAMLLALIAGTRKVLAIPVAVAVCLTTAVLTTEVGHMVATARGQSDWPDYLMLNTPPFFWLTAWTVFARTFIYAVCAIADPGERGQALPRDHNDH